ncbi:hypothetical protein [Rugosimonospora africana]|uniref:Uncharacterized protein n=1 Tax=Rugosimonospora africana TaxID=556532 RepID=A0A8J3R2V0_9ACTN|nr:hypothetical protein [Rugosimonospora africana]GIH19161.1 hypothetical protein Raf01_73330 [Rugosimonospora africana]
MAIVTFSELADRLVGGVMGLGWFLACVAVGWNYSKISRSRREQLFSGVDMLSVGRRNPWLFYMLSVLGLLFVVIAIAAPSGTK